MSTNDKPKKSYLKCLTPEGTGAYVWFSKPDEKFSKSEYKATIVIDKNDAKAMAALEKLKTTCVDAALKEWGKVPKDLQLPITDGDDGDKPEFTGKIKILTKSKNKPGAVDAKRNPLPAGIEPRSGDIMKASAVCYPYVMIDKVKEKVGGKTKIVDVTNYGIALWLSNIQLLEKRSMAGGNPANDFDDVDEYEGLAGLAGSSDDGVDESDSADF